MAATTSWRSPLGLVRSMARPRLTCSGFTRKGLPSFSWKPWFMAGIALIACTMAYPMMWVKETFPPRARLRWLLMTMRLSISSFAGTARTLVAVGIESEASMFATIRAEGPLRAISSGPAGATGDVTFLLSLRVSATSAGTGGRREAPRSRVVAGDGWGDRGAGAGGAGGFGGTAAAGAAGVATAGAAAAGAGAGSG